MTYQALLQQYVNTIPGAEVNTPEGQAAFNAWTGKFSQQFGGSWESIPDDYFTNPQYGYAQANFGANNLVGDALQSQIQYGLAQGAQRAAAGGNTNQIQGTTQQGSLTGTTEATQQGTEHNTTTQVGSQTGATQQQQQQTGQTQNVQQTSNANLQNITGNENTASSTAQQTQQSQVGTAQQRTGVATDLGLSDLIAKQGQSLAGSDAARTAFLQDTMQTGGTGFGQQVDAAIRSSLSGPGMQGVGQGAQGRVAGDAAANVARNNMDQRLAASSQLGQTTGLGTLTQQASPLMGQVSNTTQGTQTTGNTTGTQTGQTTTGQTTAGTGTSTSVGSQLSNLLTNTTGASQNTSSMSSVADALNSLTSQQKNSSEASGSSLGVATGQIPQQTTSGGGCYVCSALSTLGLIGKRSVRRAVQYKLYERRSRYMPIGYSIYGPSLAKWVVRSGWVRRLLLPLVRGILYEELRLANRRSELRLVPWATHLAFHYGSGALGYVALLFGRGFETKDTEIYNLLSENNLLFKA